MTGLSFSNAHDTLWAVIQKEFKRLQYLIQDDRLSELDRESFLGLTVSEASDAVIQKSLALLTKLLYKYHDQKVIIWCLSMPKSRKRGDSHLSRAILSKYRTRGKTVLLAA